MSNNLAIKDSGIRSEFTTGAVRDGQDGKGRMDLLPVRALIEVSKVFEAGAKKYAARNWEAGIPLSRYMDSGLRHAMKWLRGDRDEPHLAMACWNFLCLQDTQLRIAEGLLPMELNDLPCNPIELTPEAKARLIDLSRITIRRMRKGTREIKNPLYRKTRKSRG